MSTELKTVEHERKLLVLMNCHNIVCYTLLFSVFIFSHIKATSIDSMENHEAQSISIPTVLAAIVCLSRANQFAGLSPKLGMD
ncbi:hypothetical protein BT63DRAFT_424422 [Microthyrium microscopicum]|uniref:Uncharacterized protein n=1 Tax=Microthyrium microscopicum TaxID=703497 RepID=A0A6A6UFA6_9PEZI|nr:hypothetical protein BT63DRAFT_424422 [Microthyrium microscopicum]